MSRFSPNSLLDGIALPFAMVQYRGDIYVENIAPDIRPAVLSILIVALLVMWALQIFRRHSSAIGVMRHGLPTKKLASASRRAAAALMIATAVALALWIGSSANGRYGLIALTLCGPGIIAACTLLFNSRRVQLIVVSVALAIQGFLLITANPEDAWIALTPEVWKDQEGFSYAANVASALGIETGKDVVVVTPRGQTAMSATWSLFGADTRFIGGAYLVDMFSPDSAPVKRALDLIAGARVRYAVIAAPRSAVDDGVDKPVANERASAGTRLTGADKIRLKALALEPDDTRPCTVLPSRLGIDLAVCPLVQTTRSDAGMRPYEPRVLEVAQDMAIACPRLFGEMLIPGSDRAGGLDVKTHDGKYTLAVTSELDVYAKPRTQWNYVFITSGKNGPIKTQDIQLKCRKFAPPGLQYFSHS